MKKYTYEARDGASGKIVKSTVQAESESTAAKLLIAQGFAPLKIELSDEGSNIIQRLTNRVTQKDKLIFIRQLATLIGAGLPLAQSMRTVLDQTANRGMQQIIQEVIADIEGGRTLSDAFAKHPQVFDNVLIALVSAGEASGTLDEALKRVAAQQEKDASLMRKIKGALTYPIIVLVVILAVIVFMLVTVVPQVKNLYKDLNKELPVLTKAMVGAADFVISYWWIVLIVVGLAVYFLLQYLKTESGIRNKDLLKLNVPMFKGMFRKLYMARFSRTGQTLLSTGVAMLDMLHISSKAVNNVVIGDGIERAAEMVKGGKPLSSSLAREEYILEMVPQMVKIGEQSGKIDEMMGKSAQIFEEELDEEIKNLSTAIEPVLMVVLAVVAGSMVGAILFPIYGLVGGVGI